MDTTTTDPWLTRKQVADRLMLPFNTLNLWATQKKGPRYAKIGRHTRYRLSDVIAWENEQFSGGAA